MKLRYIVCHDNGTDTGSSICWRKTLQDAIAQANKHAKAGFVAVWDNQESKYVYRASPIER